MARKGLRAEALDGIQREQPCSHISRGGDKTLRVWGPLDADNLVVMPGIRAVELERREFSNKVVGSTPDLDMRVMLDCDVFAIRRKGDRLHRSLEVEMVHHHTSPKVDE